MTGAAQPRNEDAKLVVGKDNWLFLANDSNGVVLQQTGVRLLDEAALRLWRRTLELRAAYSSCRGISYSFLIAPDTHSLYPEFLPDSIQPAVVRPILQIVKHLNQASRFRVLYPLKELTEAKQSRLVAQPVDSHWSDYGCYVAYLALMAELNSIHPALSVVGEDRVAFHNADTQGDLSTKLVGHPNAAVPKMKLLRPEASPVFRNNVPNRGNMILWQNQNRSLPTCLFLADSYGYQMQGLLAESFSTMLAVHTPLYEFDLVERRRPDVVINLLAERFMLAVPDDLRGDTASALVKTKRPDASDPDWGGSV